MMNKIFAKTSEILVYNPQTQRSFSDTFVFEPENEHEKELGKLLIVVEILGKNSKSNDVSEAIATVMQHAYYSSAAESPSTQFEISIKKVNDILGDLAAKGIIFWVGKINATIAVIKDDEIHLTSTGNARILMVRKNQSTTLNKELITNAEINPLKTFESVISGNLYINDKLFFGTPEIFDYISREKLQEILVRFTPDIAARHLQSKLVSFKEKEAMAGLITAVSEKQEAPDKSEFPKPDVQTTSIVQKDNDEEGSITKPLGRRVLQKTEKPASQLSKTAATLYNLAKSTTAATRNKVFPFLKETTSKAFQTAKSAVKKFKKTSLSTNSVAKKSFKPLQTSTHSEDSSVIRTRISGFSIKSIGIYFATIARNIGKGIQTWYFYLPKKSRMLLLIALALLIALIITIAVISKKNANKKETSSIESSLNLIQSKIDDANNSLIYGDESKARSIIEEGNSILAGIDTSKFRNEKLTHIQESLDDAMNKIDHITVLDEIEPLVDLGSAGIEKSKNIDLISGKLSGYIPDSTAVFSFDLSKNEISTAELASDSKIAESSGNENVNIFLTFEPSFFEYSLDDNSTRKVESSPSTDQGIINFEVFGDRLYTLDSKNSRIQKLTRTEGGFSKGINWLKEEAVLTDTVDIAVDGDIYALNKNGSVEKYNKGHKESFELQQLAIRISNPNQINTDGDFENIYILDPQNNRFVVFDKSGNLKSQYQSVKFKDATGLTIDPNESKAYVLAQNKIFEVELK